MSLPSLRILLIFLLWTPVSAAPYFVHCYDFGCKSWMELRYSDAQWREIRSIMQRGDHDTETEKQAIRLAVATMERFSGEISGTYLDKAGNYPGYDLSGQMDCIDESTNTFQYLSALEALDLLKWHRVDLKQRRIVWFVTHWTATISELDSGRRFAVDSWYRDNGEPPYIQPIEDWQRKRDFPSEYNPELATSGGQ
jgi:hypothetical protein